ncbi:hypothetical protein [Parasitella parasitica]|uniref:Reverse transcriptase zinc-binding domain-containing protein n=1 Tax=Parasitella parasitica TaxID=35722 RepID=A0A0B7N4B2_9FUNG|nr:hypothetical protein [Parasitella parasitica]
MGPPLRLPVHLRLSPASWRLFWSLDMPVKAFTPWWSLLHDRVAHHLWCHRVVPAKVPSPTCALCGLAPEDLYHFVVGCPFKTHYWRDVVSSLSLQDLLPTGMAFWTALNSLCSQDMVILDEDVLVSLGAPYSTLWKYHWRCVINTEPWISTAAMNMFRQNHNLFYSFTSISSASDQVGTLALPSINS